MRQHAMVLALVILANGSAGAQTSEAKVVDSLEVNWLTGLSVGLPGVGSEIEPAAITLGLQFTELHPGQVGVDFALGTMPYALMNNLVAFGVRGGLALPLAIGRQVYLIPSAGVSAIGGTSGGEGDALVGMNGGVSLASLTAGLRAGVTWHRFSDVGRTVWLAEVGAVFAPRWGGGRRRH